MEYIHLCLADNKITLKPWSTVLCSLCPHHKFAPGGLDALTLWIPDTFEIGKTNENFERLKYLTNYTLYKNNIVANINWSKLNDSDFIDMLNTIMIRLIELGAIQVY